MDGIKLKMVVWGENNFVDFWFLSFWMKKLENRLKKGNPIPVLLRSALKCLVLVRSASKISILCCSAFKVTILLLSAPKISILFRSASKVQFLIRSALKNSI